MSAVLKIRISLLITFCLLSCGGSLTPEQREKARKAIEEGRIKRITPAQLTEAALAAGKALITQIELNDPYLNDPHYIDSLSRSNGVTIYALRSGQPSISDEEIAILEAYGATDDISGIGDNVQKLSGDSLLLFTHPVGNEHPDGTVTYMFAVAVKMSVKNIVLSIKE